MKRNDTRPEDQQFVNRLQELLLAEDSKLAKFGHLPCLALNGVQSIDAVKLISVGGKTVGIVQVQFRQGYLNFGSGPLTRRGPLQIGYFLLIPKGWLRIGPNPKWFRSCGKWLRSWKNLQPGGMNDIKGWNHAELLLNRPDTKWMAYNGRGPAVFPLDVRTRQPKGKLSNDGKTVWAERPTVATEVAA